jgi:major histocompatibility complex class I
MWLILFSHSFILYNYFSVLKKAQIGLGVVAHAFNPSTWEAEAGGFLNSRPAWSTESVPE